MVQPPAYRENLRISLFFTLMLGIGAGALAFWLLAVPAIKQGIYREANQQLINYSESLSSQGAELSKAQGEAKESDDTALQITQQMEEEKKKSQTYEALFKAYTAYVQESYDVAAEDLQNVNEEYLTDDMKNVYSAMCGSLGVTGVTSESQEDGNSESGSASSDESGSASSDENGSGSSEDGTF